MGTELNSVPILFYSPLQKGELKDIIHPYMNNFKHYRWILFSLIGTLYFLVCLHRVSPTVIARDLALSLHADAVVLGIIASAYFYLYSTAQPFVGYFADTLGPRKIMTLFFALSAVGSIIFGTAPNAIVATLGRVLIGAGLAGIFIPALKIFSRWYRYDEFASLTGIMITIGGLGALAATLPLTYLVLWLGWRGTFVGIGLLSLCLTAACWFIVRDAPEHKGWPAVAGGSTTLPAAGDEGLAEKTGPRKRLAMVFKKLDFWIISLATFFTGGVGLAFQGLWAVPYLMDVFGLDKVRAGWTLMLIPLGFAVGGPSLGFITDRLKIGGRKVLVGTMVAGLLCWVILYFLQDRTHLWIVVLLFSLIGFAFGGSLPICFTITRDLYPSWLMGTATGLINLAPFFGTALYQPFTGYLLQLSASVQPGVYTVSAYRVLILFFILSSVVSLLASALLLRKTNREAA